MSRVDIWNKLILNKQIDNVLDQVGNTLIRMILKQQQHKIVCIFFCIPI